MKCSGVVTLVLMVSVAGTAVADWNPKMGHKMHFPQLPDPNGWDVDFTSPKFLADDWKCSETGPVDGIHFWVSHQGGVIPVINGLDVRIFDNIPANTGGVDFSRPGEELWRADLSSADFKTAPGGPGKQGWFDPYTGEAIPNDHDSYFQINLTNFAQPFTQKRGTIYWLGISLDTSNPDGWKTADLERYPAPFTGQHYEDDAVYRDASGWHELHYPTIDPNYGGRSMDLAFVVTPEPTSMAMLGLGALGVLLRRRRSRT